MMATDTERDKTWLGMRMSDRVLLVASVLIGALSLVLAAQSPDSGAWFWMTMFAPAIFAVWCALAAIWRLREERNPVAIMVFSALIAPAFVAVPLGVVAMFLRPTRAVGIWEDGTLLASIGVVTGGWGYGMLVALVVWIVIVMPGTWFVSRGMHSR
ncbi:hypothetical protein [Microbacterium sp. A93]|uniref:hypothetical protein n=1 Tax=unclassified Microbacterium TaxID=2609290 RepID=UPI003F4247A7